MRQGPVLLGRALQPSICRVVRGEGAEPAQYSMWKG